MSDPFGAALDETAERQAQYAKQLGMKDGRIPFAAESLSKSINWKMSLETQRGLSNS